MNLIAADSLAVHNAQKTRFVRAADRRGRRAGWTSVDNGRARVGPVPARRRPPRNRNAGQESEPSLMPPMYSP